MAGSEFLHPSRFVQANRYHLRVDPDRRHRRDGDAEGPLDLPGWTGRQRIHSDDRADRNSRTEFHISKPDGWPTGKYKLEAFLNDSTAATKDFEVQR